MGAQTAKWILAFVSGAIVGSGLHEAQAGDSGRGTPSRPDHVAAPPLTATPAHGLEIAVENSASPRARANQERAQETRDWVIVPGVRIGKVTADIADTDLKRAYGDQNVTPRDVYLGEGFTEPGTAVFPDDPNRELQILWFDPQHRSRPSRIHVKGKSWRTKEGIGLGTTLNELERLNGRPFDLAGFGWDYSGTIVSWSGGQLETALTGKGRLLLRLMPEPGASYESVIGDGAFSSSHPEMQRLNPAVYALVFEFPQAPKATGAAGSLAQEPIVGQWFAGNAAQYLALEIQGDGSLLVTLHRYPTQTGQVSGSAAGRWSIRQDRFEGQIETSNVSAFPRGHQWSDEILFVDARDLVLRNQAGQIEAYRRR